MPGLELIGVEDHDAARDIMIAAYEGIAAHPRGYTKELTPEYIGRSPICEQASDVVTRTALEMGIFAMRESHRSHSITVFGAPDAVPSDKDPVMCLTWGQFLKSAAYQLELRFRDPQLPGYFGTRGGVIAMLDRLEALTNDIKRYRTESIAFRQVTYAKAPGDNPYYWWLKSSPSEVAQGKYPIGKVEVDRYHPSHWDMS